MNLYRITDVTLASTWSDEEIKKLSESSPGFTVDNVRKSEKEKAQYFIGKIVLVEDEYESFADIQIRNFILGRLRMNITSLQYEELSTIDDLRQRVINHIPDEEVDRLANCYLPKNS